MLSQSAWPGAGLPRWQPCQYWQQRSAAWGQSTSELLLFLLREASLHVWDNGQSDGGVPARDTTPVHSKSPGPPWAAQSHRAAGWFSASATHLDRLHFVWVHAEPWPSGKTAGADGQAKAGGKIILALIDKITLYLSQWTIWDKVMDCALLRSQHIAEWMSDCMSMLVQES